MTCSLEASSRPEGRSQAACPAPVAPGSALDAGDPDATDPSLGHPCSCSHAPISSSPQQAAAVFAWAGAGDSAPAFRVPRLGSCRPGLRACGRLHHLPWALWTLGRHPVSQVVSSTGLCHWLQQHLATVITIVSDTAVSSGDSPTSQAPVCQVTESSLCSLDSPRPCPAPGPTPCGGSGPVRLRGAGAL